MSKANSRKDNRDMDMLTPTEQATLDALRAGPGTATDIRERSGRSRSATDKALTQLARIGLATKTDPENPADGPARWQINEPDLDETSGPGDVHNDDADETSDSASLAAETGPHTETGQADPDASPDTVETAEPSAADGETGNNTAPPDPAEAPQPEVKVCRGCQDQIPVVCPCCWQRTTSYCGKCRKTMPATRRGNPGEPVILSNGLPKLRPGELERLVTGVMQDNPVPEHIGITGWTSGRIAIYLPGRSTGAISKALNNLVTSGFARLIGDAPKRYVPATERRDTQGTDPQPPATEATGVDVQQEADGAVAQHADEPDPAAQPHGQ